MNARLQGPSGQILLGETPITIGSADTNKLVVRDPGVNAQHAEIRLEQQGYKITDLGSTNGTFIREQKLPSRLAVLLQSGDTIRVGYTTFIFEVSDVPAPLATAEEENSAATNPYEQTTLNYQPQGTASPIVTPAPALQPSATPATQYAPTPLPIGGGFQQGQAIPSGQPGQPGFMPVGWGPVYVPQVVPVAAAPTRRVWLPWLLASLVVLLVLGSVGTYFLVTNLTRPVAQKTLNDFCTGLRTGDYQTAYDQLSSFLQKTQTEQEFATTLSQSFAALGGITSCIVSNVQELGGTAFGTISMAYGNGSSQIDDYALTNENGAWKIIVSKPHSA